MKGDRSPSEDIEIIIRFCNSIESAMEHFGKDEEDFLGSELYQNSCCFALLQIGEAVKRLPKEVTARYPDIEWSDIAGMRDFIVHSYRKTSMHRVWIAMTKEVPSLRSKCETILTAQLKSTMPK